MTKINRFLNGYLGLFLIYTLFGRIVPLSLLMEGTLNSIMFILFAFFGVIFVAIDFFSTKYLFKAKYQGYLILFLVIMMISSLKNMEYGLVDNIKTIVWTAIHFLLLYPYFLRENKQQHKLFLRKVLKMFVGIFSIAALISFLQYLFQIGYTIEVEGRMLRQGFVDHRLFGIFKDPNFAASTALIAMVGAMYLIYTTKKTNLKFLYVLSIGINFVYIVLSGSRSVLLAYVAFVVVFFFLLVRRFTLMHYDFANRVAYCLISALIAIGLSLSSYYATKMVCEQLTFSNESEVLEREDVDVQNISNNRFDIWVDYLKATFEKENILFGLSPRNATLYIQEHHPESYVGKTGYETHNAYISLVSGVGLVGTLCMGMVIVLSIRNVICQVFIKKEYNIFYVMALSIIAGLVCYAFFLTDLFFVNNVTTIVFWPLLGYLNNNQDKQRVMI